MFLARSGFSDASRFPVPCPYKTGLMFGTDQLIPSGNQATIQFSVFSTTDGNGLVNIDYGGEGQFIAKVEGFYAFCPTIGLAQAGTTIPNVVSVFGKITQATPNAHVVPSLFYSQPNSTIDADGLYTLPSTVLAAYLKVGDLFEIIVDTPSAPLAISWQLTSVRVSQLC